MTLLEISAHCLWQCAHLARGATATREREGAIETLTQIASVSRHDRLRRLAAGVLISTAHQRCASRDPRALPGDAFGRPTAPERGGERDPHA